MIERFERDILLILGQSAVGKTRVFNAFVDLANLVDAPYESKLISDFHYLLKQVRKDDVCGGFQHYHEWCAEKKMGHSHKSGEEEIPFTVINNTLTDKMLNEFFSEISSLPKSDKFWFVEWTGGVNTNLAEEPASAINLSFQRVINMLQMGILPSEWVKRIYAIIHPMADRNTRYLLNSKEHDYHLKDLLSSKFSARRISTVLETFGQDDFFKVEQYFKNALVPYIFSVKNDGDNDFFKKLEMIARIIFALDNE